MPSDPENKAEELLKAYARKRQDEAGAPLELHPATRKLLQDEVARQRPRPAGRRESWFRRMLVFWPQLAMTASVLLALGIAAWVLSPPPGRDETVLAKLDNAPPAPDRFAQAALPANQPQSAPREDSIALSKRLGERDRDGMAPAGEPASAVAAPTSPAVELAREHIDAIANRRLALNEVTLADTETTRRAGWKPASAGAGVNPPGLYYSFNGGTATNGYLSSDRFSAGHPHPILPSLELAATDAQAQPKVESATTASKDLSRTKEAFSTSAKSKTLDDGARLAAASTSDAYDRQRGVAGGAASNAGSLRLRFAQPPLLPATGEPGTAPATAPAVLSQFEVKQDGLRVQLVDFDGSVYDGWVVANGDATDPSFGRVPAQTEARLQPQPIRKEETRQQSAEFDALQLAGTGLRNVAFRVSGISRHLGQPIVVEGTMIIAADQAAVSDAPAPKPAPPRGPGRPVIQTREARPTTFSAGATGPGTETNANRVQRVVGKVRIGATNEVRVDAVPAKN